MVEGLGPFLEFEAVIGPEEDEATGRRRLEELAQRFSLDSRDLCPRSYCDMLS